MNPNKNIVDFLFCTIFFTVFISETSAQESHLLAASDQQIFVALHMIENDYVDQIDGTSLVTACVTAMTQDASALACQKPVAETIARKSTQSEFIDTISCIRLHHPEITNDPSYVGACIRGMFTRIDSLSKYYDAEAFNDVRRRTAADDGGVDIEVRMVNGHLLVQPTNADTPAYQAGIKAGDWIVKVDDTDVTGMTPKEVATRLRGKPNTDVALTLMRTAHTAPIVVTLKRAKIQIDSVKYRLLEPSYAYVRIARFDETSDEKFVAGLEDMWRQSNGQVKGLVLDLRGNPGGLLTSVGTVAGAFLPRNSLLGSTKGRANEFNTQLYAPLDSDWRFKFLKKLPEGVKSVPMIVMVNADSAGASESVAGALQDYGRAKIIGAKTAGKGSVQTFRALGNNTGLKITISRLYRPSGKAIDAAVSPDIPIEEADWTPKYAGLGEIDPTLAVVSKLLHHLAP